MASIMHCRGRVCGDLGCMKIDIDGCGSKKGCIMIKQGVGSGESGWVV